VEFSSLIGWWKFDGIYFVFFFPPAKKVKETPTHVAAYFQAHTSLRSAQRLVKELHSTTHHSTATIIHSLIYEKKIKKILD
jgi:hypothetical protein